MNGIAELSHWEGALDLNTEARQEPAGKELGPRSLRTGVASSRASVCRAREQPKPWQGVSVFLRVTRPACRQPILVLPYQEADARRRVQGLAVMSSL